MWDSLEAEAMDLINKFSQKGDSQNKKDTLLNQKKTIPLKKFYNY